MITTKKRTLPQEEARLLRRKLQLREMQDRLLETLERFDYDSAWPPHGIVIAAIPVRIDREGTYIFQCPRCGADFRIVQVTKFFRLEVEDDDSGDRVELMLRCSTCGDRALPLKANPDEGDDWFDTLPYPHGCGDGRKI
jgi:uncharacterized C2H2 Zn-finger protein